MCLQAWARQHATAEPEASFEAALLSPPLLDSLHVLIYHLPGLCCLQLGAGPVLTAYMTSLILRVATFQ